MNISATVLDPDKGDSLSFIGQGLLSIGQVPELHRLTGLRRLCLHGNNITRIDGVQGLTNLVELNLSSNAVSSLDPGSLRCLTRLTLLNLASNRLQAVQGLDGLANLEQLNLSYNYITSIAGLTALQGPQCKLRQLNLKHNQLHNLQAFSVLVGCISLRSLQVVGNPVCQLPNYMQALATVLAHVTQLDSVSSADALAAPYDVQAAQQYAAVRLQSFEPVPPVQPAPAPSAPPPLVQVQQRTRPTAHPTQSPDWQAKPPVDTVGRYDNSLQQLRPGTQQYQQQPASPPRVGPYSQTHPPGPTTAPQNLQFALSVERSSVVPAATSSLLQIHSRAPGNRQLRHPGGVGGGTSGTLSEVHEEEQLLQQGDRDGSRTTVDVLPAPDQLQTLASVRQQSSQPQQRVVKVLHSDAAAQTSEYTPLVRRLQVEAVEMRQQLSKLADELERRNAAEESLRAAMQEAITAAQEDAHRRVEDGFREASFAVSKALQELESARHAAAESQQRIAGHLRGEEEQRVRCVGLEKDVARLREELQRLNQQLLGQQQAAAAALDDERRRAAAAEAAAREQLATAQAAAADLPVLRAAMAAAEQKVAGLEAALQQSSSVTVSMTAKIAQTMADANAQIDVLKARLSTAEQQLAEHQRKDVEARAEINTLTAALQAARLQQEKDLEAAARQHEEALRAAVEKERAAAEERGKGAAALQAQQERAGLQEQIAFLKVQLQFALKESDKEQQAAHQLLRAAQTEVSELRAALQAAATKQREGEALVADLTSVVQQQKAAIQSLQREKEALAARLKACSPGAFDALAAENLHLKRAAAERDMYREQLEDARRCWQEAERRVTELQVSSSRTADELGARVRSAEAALAAAREDIAKAEALAERLRQEVAAQQDIVKIKVAMLDSANDTIASLKAEIADLQVEADEARRAAEEAEAALAREQQQHEHDDEESDGEKAQLRQEAQLAEAAAAAARAELGEAQSRLKDFEALLRTKTEQVAEKDRMLAYVQEEVDRVQVLFEKRAQQLRDERDTARSDATAAAAARATAESRLGEASGRIDRLMKELDNARAQLEDAAMQLEDQRHAAAAASEAAAARGAEAARLSARVAEVEGEMRQLLEAVERQKASSAHKMRQLASLLQEL
ncbi:hypothetical protein VOLCADRAFT_56822 [Volvox carteri f. nagariensis]|uniref:Uncharacterized protein n=1 Tax=Volvox carteri f. nagariensis TaxID=3068 RepID=D8TLK0_VOLCA|nr:uncharacterized protein VOLCADRAFT_56822 [Volvox carteri f. nagariensis]EFJ51748.1 hypothetical protein VOLCADRAFT_56822 [Volvox carteri f. nagariensis]|eukprot:XP_002947158.1 hypothetical protein VOLCADRAFT_56822 [Volvox carteri f. nagariensis]